MHAPFPRNLLTSTRLQHLRIRKPSERSLPFQKYPLLRENLFDIICTVCKFIYICSALKRKYCFEVEMFTFYILRLNFPTFLLFQVTSRSTFFAQNKFIILNFAKVNFYIGNISYIFYSLNLLWELIVCNLLNSDTNL